MNKTTAQKNLKTRATARERQRALEFLKKKTRTQKEVYRTDAAFAVARVLGKREREREREERKKAKENASRGSGDLSRSSTLFPVV